MKYKWLSSLSGFVCSLWLRYAWNLLSRFFFRAHFLQHINIQQLLEGKVQVSLFCMGCLTYIWYFKQPCLKYGWKSFYPREPMFKNLKWHLQDFLLPCILIENIFINSSIFQYNIICNWMRFHLLLLLLVKIIQASFHILSEPVGSHLECYNLYQ